MKAQRGRRGIALPVNLGTRRVGWPIPHPVHFIPVKEPREAF